MAYEQRDNSGAVFVNNEKESDNHPDRKGDAKIGGVDYWVSGWLKKTKDGQTFMSLAFKAKDAAKPAATGNSYRAAKDGRDDKPPF